VTFFWITVLVAAAVLVSWVPVRWWHRRADARRLEARRAMSGDADILVPDYESTLAIAIAAPAGTVWDALLRFGWPREGRRTYEWLGRAFGFLEPYAAGAALEAPPAPASLSVGRRSQIAVRSIDPIRTLVLGRETGTRRWAWQFEVSALDEHRTRVILRDRARVAATISGWLFLVVSRAFSFVLTRKMLLDIKMAAEAASRGSGRTAARVA
jgi:hypothetical protein